MARVYAPPFERRIAEVPPAIGIGLHYAIVCKRDVFKSR